MTTIEELTDQLQTAVNLVTSHGRTLDQQVVFITSEVGEVAEEVVRLERLNPRKPAGNINDLREELGDLLLTASMMCIMAGGNPIEQLQYSLNKMNRRNEELATQQNQPL